MKRYRKLAVAVATMAVVATSMMTTSVQTASAATTTSCPQVPLPGGNTAPDIITWSYKSGKSFTTSQNVCISNERYNRRLVWQTDGNLVVYSTAHTGGKALWSSKTYGKNAARLAFQTDGNVVIYDKSGKAIWSTNTWRTDATTKQVWFSMSIDVEDENSPIMLSLFGFYSKGGVPTSLWEGRRYNAGWYVNI